MKAVNTNLISNTESKIDSALKILLVFFFFLIIIYGFSFLFKFDSWFILVKAEGLTLIKILK
ncbi:Uncharacterised protein [Helicobacter fennelliae]|nr:Uncharacterised protein [Helicobacter fennelliae]